MVAGRYKRNYNPQSCLRSNRAMELSSTLIYVVAVVLSVNLALRRRQRERMRSSRLIRIVQDQD